VLYKCILLLFLYVCHDAYVRISKVFMKRGGIVIELKTLYGFGSALFTLVADSRAGVHGQVDVRKYFIKGMYVYMYACMCVM
jgi:hypothetical protein